jgi:uncharacterized protein YydD (DUF2326 family)
MFIKSLTIEDSGGIIREILFHKGLNLIVDETKLNNEKNKVSGNNVGKTTVIRLINFCLGGDAKNIYRDPEFQHKTNEAVEQYLIDEQVVITLKLRDDLDDVFSREITIRKNFLPHSQKILDIDGQSVETKAFDATLKKLIFGFEGEKPTFKQLKAKNIRDEAERLEKTVKVLGSFGKDEEYEALYLFWLGIEYPDAENKRLLLDAYNLEKKINGRLSKDHNRSKLQQFLTIIDREIESLEEKKKAFNLNEDYELDLENLNSVRANLNKLYSMQSQMELRKELIEESRRELEKDTAQHDAALIAELYSQAKVLIPNLQKSYEDTIVFHNSMIAEKVIYITKELPDLNQKLIQLNFEIQQDLVKEKDCVDKLQKLDAMEELDIIIGGLNTKYERKGRWMEQIDQLDASDKELERLEENLKYINEDIEKLNPLVQQRIARFNEFFSDISQNLYGESFALSADYEKSKNKQTSFYKLNVDSLSGRAGTGKKKGEIAAFDIAYVKFADDQRIPCLHFILHDQMEVVDDNQIVGLLKELVQANCQFVVPILRDKLPEELNKPEYQILSLSQNDKLFRI